MDEGGAVRTEVAIVGSGFGGIGAAIRLRQAGVRDLREVRPHAIVTADGVEHPVDAIGFGTGFRPTDPPLAPLVRGREGHSLAAAWAGSPKAHLGTLVAGFPNLFLLLGPNTGLGHSSVVLMIEAQIEHLLLVLDQADRDAFAVLERSPG